MKRVVISQPMLFPWVGMFEQIRLADTYVHYDDVQFSKGSFVNRVQIKTRGGTKWLTVPLRNLRLGQEIKDVALDDRYDWRRAHVDLLAQAYDTAPFKEEMLALARTVYAAPCATISGVAAASLAAVCNYFELTRPESFLFSSQLGIGGQSSRRVLDIVKHLGGDTYITGHGAQHYLDHELFAREGVHVEYMNYQKREYRQLHGAFTPYVSILDLIANEGRDGLKVITSGTVYWKDFIV